MTGPEDDSEYLIWDTVSMAWTEIGLLVGEDAKIVAELRRNHACWDDVERCILRDVVASFAPGSLLVFLMFVPVIGLFAAAGMPDWGYEEAWIRRRIARWHARPYWLHWCNPFRILGYPVAWLWSFGVRRALKRAWRTSADVAGDQAR